MRRPQTPDEGLEMELKGSMINHIFVEVTCRNVNIFLAVQDSSIGDLVTHSLSNI